MAGHNNNNRADDDKRRNGSHKLKKKKSAPRQQLNVEEAPEEEGGTNASVASKQLSTSNGSSSRKRKNAPSATTTTTTTSTTTTTTSIPATHPTTKKKKKMKATSSSVAPPKKLCNCNQPVCQRTVKKEGPNQGRKFWGCSHWHSKENGCRFFEWVDEEQQEEEEENDSSAVATAAAAAAAAAAFINNSKKKKDNNNVNVNGITIKVVTMNVAGFQPHSYAPTTKGGFDPRDYFEKEILQQEQPDILALQELPQPAMYEYFDGYICVGTTPSHCGYVGLYVRQGFLQQDHCDDIQQVSRIQINNRNNSSNNRHAPQTSTTTTTTPAAALGGMTSELPVVLASILFEFDDVGVAAAGDDKKENKNKKRKKKELVVGSCHLEPHKQGSGIRLAQFEAISNAAIRRHKKKDDAQFIILAGDMNMRNNEDDAVQRIHSSSSGDDNDGGWKDAWKEAGSIRKEAYTWNSKINHYHGKDSFQFHCRFDRVYLHGNGNVQSFQLIANRPITTTGTGTGRSPYYLSDHFGIATTIVI